MLVPMSKVEVVGRLQRLDEALGVLHSLSAVHVVDSAPAEAAAPDPSPRSRRDVGDRIRVIDALLTRVDDVLARSARIVASAGNGKPDRDPHDGPVDEADLIARLNLVEPQLGALEAERAALRSQLQSLPRYIDALERLLPLNPDLALLDDDRLGQLGLATVVAVLDSSDPDVPAVLQRDLTDALGDRVAVTTGRTDERTVGAVVVYAHEDGPTVHAVLGRDHVTHAELPQEFASHGPGEAIAAMREQFEQLPHRLADVGQRLDAVLGPHLPVLRRAQARLTDEKGRLRVAGRIVTTERTFVLAGWLPTDSVPTVQAAVDNRFAGEVVLTQVASSADDASAPVLLRNRAAARPYEALVSFLALPRPGSTDPTTLMALALPVFFGMMVGDLGYGLLLLVIAWLVRRRMGRKTAFAADVARILTACAAASIVFGLLFGEFFGSLGNKLGMPALWFYRGGPDALQPLLLLALGMGAAHIVLALLLGVWQAVRDRHLHAAAERVGSLLVITGLFGFAAATVVSLPEELFTVKVAAIVVGLVLVTSLSGLLGLITGPLELLGVIGNILSYLRLAAVGLASVYLANVANELAVVAPLGIGIVVAVFFHALNLALATFSPLIQALRLHYVEMFSKFFEPGGQPYTPFGRPTPGAPEDPQAPPASDPPSGDSTSPTSGGSAWK